MEVSKLELSSPSISFRDFHYPAEPKKRSDGSFEPEERISSIYAQSIKKNSFGTHNLEMFESKTREADSTKYSIKDEGFSFLTHVNIAVELPYLEVENNYKDTIQICYPNNLAHSIIKESTLMINDDNPPIQSWSTVTLDNYIDRFMDGEEKEQYREKFRNTSELTEWNSRLPSMELVVPQHWSVFRSENFNNKPRGALPLFYKKNKIFFNYKFNLALVDLLKMRIRKVIKSKKDLSESGEISENYVEENGKLYTQWKMVKPNMEFIKGISESKKLKMPELWGLFDLIPEAEIKFYKDVSKGPHEVWVKDFIYFKSGAGIELARRNQNKNVKPVEISLSSPYACKSIHWLAQNKNSEQLNQPSNYTTNIENPLQGWSPLGDVCISYSDGTEKVKKMNSQKVSSMFDKFFPGKPSTAGLCGISISKNPTLIRADLTIDISNGMKVTFDIMDQNPYSHEGVAELSPDQKISKMFDEKPKHEVEDVSFIPYVIISVDKKISFVDGEKVKIHKKK